MRKKNIKKIIIISLLILAVIIGAVAVYNCSKIPRKSSEDKSTTSSDLINKFNLIQEWGNIHPDFRFNPELINEWKLNFDKTPQRVKEIILEGFKPDESLFHTWVIHEKHDYLNLTKDKVAEYREEWKKKKDEYLRNKVLFSLKDWKKEVEISNKEEGETVGKVFEELANKKETKKEEIKKIKWLVDKYSSNSSLEYFYITEEYLDLYLKGWEKELDGEI